jgi:cold shock CspA family protein
VSVCVCVYIPIGYGFIKHPDFGRNIFFHAKHCIVRDEMPNVGDIVSFVMGENPKKGNATMAVQVQTVIPAIGRAANARQDSNNRHRSGNRSRPDPHQQPVRSHRPTRPLGVVLRTYGTYGFVGQLQEPFTKVMYLTCENSSARDVARLDVVEMDLVDRPQQGTTAINMRPLSYSLFDPADSTVLIKNAKLNVEETRHVEVCIHFFFLFFSCLCVCVCVGLGLVFFLICFAHMLMNQYPFLPTLISFFFSSFSFAVDSLSSSRADFTNMMVLSYS